MIYKSYSGWVSEILHQLIDGKHPKRSFLGFNHPFGGAGIRNHSQYVQLPEGCTTMWMLIQSLESSPPERFSVSPPETSIVNVPLYNHYISITINYQLLTSDYSY